MVAKVDKECLKCKEKKPRDEFYAHPYSAGQPRTEAVRLLELRELSWVFIFSNGAQVTILKQSKPVTPDQPVTEPIDSLTYSGPTDCYWCGPGVAGGYIDSIGNEVCFACMCHEEEREEDEHERRRWLEGDDE